MGAGLTLRRAIFDLQQTPPGPMRDALVRRVIELHNDRGGGDPGTRKDEDELMRSLPFVEELERRCRAEGRTEGTLIALVRVVERRLRREVSASEREALGARLDQLGESAIDAALDLDPVALQRWINRTG